MTKEKKKELSRGSGTGPTEDPGWPTHRSGDDAFERVLPPQRKNSASQPGGNKNEVDLPTAKAARPAERPPSGLSVPSHEEKHNKTASAHARTIGKKR